MRIILHIGTEKTGTTSLQHFLFNNRAALRQQGVLYPEDLCGMNHICLPALGLGDPHSSEIAASAYRLIEARGETDMASYVRKTLAKQIGKYKPKVLLFSNEHLHSRLTSVEQIAKLRGVLTEFSDDVSVLVYLRRQDRLAVSSYSTAFKFGKASTEPSLPPAFPEFAGAPPHYYDYEHLLDMWQEVFGRESLVVRRFEREVAKDGGLLASFLEAARATVRLESQFVSRNESISGDAILFLAHFNAQLKRRNLSYPDAQRLRGPLVHFLERNYPGKTKPASRSAAETFYRRFLEANRRIAERFFSEGEALFDGNFDEYAVDYAYRADAGILSEIAARYAVGNALGESNDRW